MFREPLEPWEVWGYPLLAVLTIAWLSWPPSFYWSQVLRWETLAWIAVGAGEVYHFRRRRPGLSRAILMALPMSLAFGLLNPGDPRLVFWIAIGLCGYLWLLESTPDLLARLRDRLRRGDE